ncbi:MAG: DNA translocase FtsK [Lachnospiraceae bacterium]|nr:DNA translocase FtsK [Lachnospiraceae bacterium]
MISGYNEFLGFFEHFTHSQLDYTGNSPAYGGLLGGILCCILCPLTGKAASIIIMIVLAIIFFLLIAGRAIFTPLTKKGIEHHREHREQERLRRESGMNDIVGDGVRSRRERRALEANMSIEEAEKIVREAHEKTEKKKGFIDMLLEEGRESGVKSDPEQYVNDRQDACDGEIEFATEDDAGEDVVAREIRRKFSGRDTLDPTQIGGSHTQRGQILGRRGVNRHCMVDDDFETAVGRMPKSREEEYTQSDFEEVGENGNFLSSENDHAITPDDIEIRDDIVMHDGETGLDPSITADDPSLLAGDGSATTGATTENADINTLQKAESKVVPYVFPPISLLTKNKAASKNGDRRELHETVEKLQSTFKSFGVGVTVTDATCGPTVTRYELLPDQGVKVKTITALADDVKLALAASEIRIEAPIPGKAAVGIEVPNAVTSPVLLRDLIDSPEFSEASSPLTFAVGKDISGRTICFDIASMPHMLVAGATGSGKSVCINCLIMSIIYKAKPSEVRMIMIDPKRVELIGYNGIPHLLAPVVTDVKKANGVLDWAIHEMDDRYQRFADSGVNNLASYNRVIEEKYYEDGNEGECPDRLPQILIIVDELNDLMMTANSKEVEASICRLTQLARACGIHVVLATQRPSVNVITGTIKANIPSRIAFSVSSLVDSRTIIDQAGAEKLLGKGDMLFYPQGYPKPVRLQGAYVSDREVAEVVTFVKSKYKEIKYSETLGKHIENAGNKGTENTSGDSEGAGDDRDELYAEAGRFIIETQKASMGSLQRKFKIGFNRAARIMDNLAMDEVVGPDEGTKARKILMTSAQFNDFLSSGSSCDTTDEEGEENNENRFDDES